MLKEFGLTNTEEKVYLALLSIDTSIAADIIRKTQLHRTTVYDVLERLIEKGLVSQFLQNKIRHYSASNPSKFLEMASEEKEKAREKEKFAKKVIEDISRLRKNNKKTSIAEIFIGEEGAKTIMADIIQEEKEFYILGSGGTFGETSPAYTQHWAKERLKKNIKAKIIATAGSKTPIWRLNEIKYISKEYQSPTVSFIYGDKVAIFVHEDPVTIILIKNSNVSKSYKNYFNLLWRIAKPKN
jgi:sugar-specific transcriptional regulator TrmB